MDQAESVFGSADKEETDFPLVVRNKLVRVLPNKVGFKQNYVNKKSLKKWEFVEVPVFSQDQELLLKDLTKLMSEPESMHTLQNENTDRNYRLKLIGELTKNVNPDIQLNIEEENNLIECVDISKSDCSTPS